MNVHTHGKKPEHPETPICARGKHSIYVEMKQMETSPLAILPPGYDTSMPTEREFHNMRAIHQPLPPQCWITGVHSHHPIKMLISFEMGTQS